MPDPQLPGPGAGCRLPGRLTPFPPPQAAGTTSRSSVAPAPSSRGPAWLPGPSLATARHYLGLAALDATLYAVGGHSGGPNFASVEVLVVDAACDATTPAQPPAPSNTSTGFTLSPSCFSVW